MCWNNSHVVSLITVIPQLKINKQNTIWNVFNEMKKLQRIYLTSKNHEKRNKNFNAFNEAKNLPNSQFPRSSSELYDFLELLRSSPTSNGPTCLNRKRKNKQQIMLITTSLK